MKIGIMFSDQSPQIGGGFTFEQGILDSLLRLKGETKHQLHLLGHAREKPEGLDGLPWVSTKATLSKGEKISREVGRMIKKVLPAAKDSKQETYIFDFERSPEVKAAALDLIVYLNPFETPFLDIPYIINVWDLAHRIAPFFPEISLTGEWEFRERLYSERLRRAFYIITPNEQGKREIIDFYQVPGERIRPMHHPTPDYVLRVGAEEGKATSLTSLGITGDFLLYPAQFWPHKNHVLLLRMLEILRDKHGYTPQLVLTGSDKPLFKYAEHGNLPFIKQRAREMGLEKQVIFAGFVSREHLIALYRQAVALVFPSMLGVENLPPIEAFTLGCPALVARVPGSEEQFGDAAFQLDPTKPEEWADVLQRVRRDAALRASHVARGVTRARQITSDDFTRGLFQLMNEFEPYRCNWTSAPAEVPLKPGRYAIRLPAWESRYKRSR